MTDPRPVPRDIDITRVVPLFVTPCWVVHRAHHGGRVITACELLPELMSAPRSPERLTGTLDPADAASRQLDTAKEAALMGLAAAFGPVMARLSDSAAGEHALAPVIAYRASEDTGAWWALFRIDPDRVGAAPDTPLGADDLLAIAAHLGKAMRFLHDGGCQHLDIAPATVALGERSAFLSMPGAVMRDLGTAKSDEELLARAATAPPELVDVSGRAAIGPWTDIYMASATLFHLATGKPAPNFTVRSPAPAVFAAEVREALAPIADRPGLVAAIVAGLDARSRKRPQNVAAWLEMMGPEAAAILIAPLPELPIAHDNAETTATQGGGSSVSTDETLATTEAGGDATRSGFLQLLPVAIVAVVVAFALAYFLPKRSVPPLDNTIVVATPSPPPSPEPEPTMSDNATMGSAEAGEPPTDAVTPRSTPTLPPEPSRDMFEKTWRVDNQPCAGPGRIVREIVRTDYGFDVVATFGSDKVRARYTLGEWTANGWTSEMSIEGDRVRRYRLVPAADGRSFLQIGPDNSKLRWSRC